MTHALIEAALELKQSLGFQLHVGLSASDDAFYGETPEFIQMLHKNKLINVEMESSAIYTVAHRRGLKAAMVCAVSGNLITGEVVYEEVNQGLIQGWEHAIQVALEGIARYELAGYEHILARD